MKKIQLMTCACALAFGTLTAAGPVLADKDGEPNSNSHTESWVNAHGRNTKANDAAQSNSNSQEQVGVPGNDGFLLGQQCCLVYLCCPAP